MELERRPGGYIMDPYTRTHEDAIMQYVGIPVLDLLRKDPENALKLSRRNIPATIFFADIQAYADMADDNNPEKMIDHLNIFYELTSEIILRNNGFIDSFIGDSVFAVFGISKKQHADDACKAAVECIKSLDQLNNKRQNDAKIKAGIGINSGIVTIGTIGSKHKLKFTALGDTVNWASKMESLTRKYKCDIILTESTQKSLTLNYKTKELDKIPVKTGSEKKFSIYTLMV
jgi:adenylate cyclase